MQNKNAGAFLFKKPIQNFKIMEYQTNSRELCDYIDFTLYETRLDPETDPPKGLGLGLRK
jgi:hypothetical protein